MSPDISRAYAMALDAEHRAVAAYLSTGVGAGLKARQLLHANCLALASDPIRYRECIRFGAIRSHEVARLFRNAMLLRDLEIVCNAHAKRHAQ